MSIKFNFEKLSCFLSSDAEREACFLYLNAEIERHIKTQSSTSPIQILYEKIARIICDIENEQPGEMDAFTANTPYLGSIMKALSAGQENCWVLDLRDPANVGWKKQIEKFKDSQGKGTGQAVDDKGRRNI